MMLIKVECQPARSKLWKANSNISNGYFVDVDDTERNRLKCRLGQEWSGWE